MKIKFKIPKKYRGAGVAVFRINNGTPEVLMGLRAISPGKEKWSFPGGTAKRNETLKDTAMREFKEETRIQIQNEYIKRTEIFKIRLLFFFWDTIIIETTQDMNKLPQHYCHEFNRLEWIPLSRLNVYKLHLFVRSVVKKYQKGRLQTTTP